MKTFYYSFFQFNFSQDLKYLQKIAVDNNLILVANLLEKDSDDLYSTTIVFDGLNKDATEMLAKYVSLFGKSKIKLFFEH